MAEKEGNGDEAKRTSKDPLATSASKRDGGTGKSSKMGQNSDPMVAAPPIFVNAGTTEDLEPERATDDWEVCRSELVCDVQPPSVDIKMLASVIRGEAVLDREKPFPKSFNNQGVGYVLPALSRYPWQRIPTDE